MAQSPGQLRRRHQYGRRRHMFASAFSVEEVTAFYAYDDSVPLDAVRKSLDSTTWYDQSDVEYRSLGETVYARLVVPKSDKAVPCIVGVHGMFSDNIYQFWTAADFAAKRGFAVIVPSLIPPQAHSGATLIPGQQLVVGPPEVVKGNLRRAVVVSVERWLRIGSAEIDQVDLCGGDQPRRHPRHAGLQVDPRFAKGVAVVGGSGVGGFLENGRIDMLNMFRAAARAGLVNPQVRRRPQDRRPHQPRSIAPAAAPQWHKRHHHGRRQRRAAQGVPGPGQAGVDQW